MTSGASRRTQEQRRSETIAKIIDATIEAIEHVGYHRTSLGEICGRSGVSRGGVFRHFDSRLDVIVATAEEVARRHMAAFDELRVDDRPLSIEETLAFARTRVRHSTNTVWFEVCVAARTEPDLRERIAPITKWLYDGIEERALANFADTGAPPALIRLVVTSAVHMFDGEAIIGDSYPRPDLEAARLDAAAYLLRLLAREAAQFSDPPV